MAVPSPATPSCSESTIANAQGSNSVSLPLVLGGDGLFQVSLGSLAVGGTIDNGGHLLTVNTADSSSTIISGSVSGAGGLVKSGTGTLTLSGVSTYSGDTVVSAGMLVITNSGSLPSGGSLTVSAGGILVFGSSAAGAPAPPAGDGSLDATAALGAQNQSPAAGSSHARAIYTPASLAPASPLQNALVVLGARQIESHVVISAARATGDPPGANRDANGQDAGAAMSGRANVGGQLASGAGWLWDMLEYQAQQRLKNQDQALLIRDTILAEYGR